jgi:hypothetical protein
MLLFRNILPTMVRGFSKLPFLAANIHTPTVCSTEEFKKAGHIGRFIKFSLIMFRPISKILPCLTCILDWARLGTASRFTSPLQVKPST